MGCCGEPVDKTAPEDVNRVTPFDAEKAIAQQPSPQPGIQWQQEKQALQQPTISSPPPVLQYGQPQQPNSPYHTTFQLNNGQQWTQSQQQFNAYGATGVLPPPSPAMFNSSEFGQSQLTRSSTPSTYVANPLNAYSSLSIAQPSTARHGPSMSISGRRTASPPAQPSGFVPVDEGKLSVSIDFGE